MSELFIHLTSEQKRAFLELCRKRKTKQGILIRELIRQACQREGIVFEKDAQWGGKREGKAK